MLFASVLYLGIAAVSALRYKYATYFFGFYCSNPKMSVHSPSLDSSRDSVMNFVLVSSVQFSMSNEGFPQDRTMQSPRRADLGFLSISGLLSLERR